MPNLKNPEFLTSNVSGHYVRSVVAYGEPDRQRARALQDLADALPEKEAMRQCGARITEIATTPDFHAGKPVPVGVIVRSENAIMPHLVGNDIGCGMRMIVLSNVSEADLIDRNLERHLRHIFFQGGRNIALRGKDRHAILREGLPGFLESITDRREGLLAKIDLKMAWSDIDRTCDLGMYSAVNVDPDLTSYSSGWNEFSRDAIIGSIGGGNHFVEIGVIDRIADGGFARECGLKTGSVVVVVHSGSLDFGQRIGSTAKERMMSSAEVDKRVVRVGTGDYTRYVDGHANAANFAYANRFLIGYEAVEAISRLTGREVEHQLIYDAPHNTVWIDGDFVTHRKGACPARGQGELRGSPYEWIGEPVILPGSMGDGSWLLKGLGSKSTISSSAHGAGRKLSRSEARASERVPNSLRVVGPVDVTDPKIAGRTDILKEVSARLNEEAPGAYRPIDDVVTPMVDAGLVARVAKIRPVLTVKG